MRCLIPSSPEFLDVDSLKPLVDYTSLIPGFYGELGIGADIVLMYIFKIQRNF